MMMLCEHCANGGYHGYRRDGWPSTISFWCESFNTHHQYMECDWFKEGMPKRYDKRGELIEGEKQ